MAWDGVCGLEMHKSMLASCLTDGVWKRVLLHGPAGTGKTMMIKALGKQWKTRFIDISNFRIFLTTPEEYRR